MSEAPTLWLAKDRDNYVSLFKGEPTEKDMQGIRWYRRLDESHFDHGTLLHPSLFAHITITHDTPVEVTLQVKEVKK